MDLSEADLAAIRALATAMDEAALANDFVAVTNLFTEDCLIMVPNAESVEGRADFLSMVQSAGYEFSAHSITFRDVYGQGDVAYVRATYDETYSMTGMVGSVSDSGKLLTVVRKQPDGSWRFSVWMWNSDLPLPSMEGEQAE